MEALKLDPGVNLKLVIRKSREQTLVFRVQDSSGDPYTIQDDFAFGVKRDARDKNYLFRLTTLPDGGITVNGNDLSVPLTEDHSNIDGREHYFELVNLTQKKNWVQGPLEVLTGNAPHYNTSSSATLSINTGDSVVEITVQGGGEVTAEAIDNALGYVPASKTRQLAINGKAFDLEGDREWVVAGGPIDVLNYGVLGDGQTDCFATVQQIITNNTGRKIVIGRYVAEVFILSQPLVLPEGTILEINGTLKLKDPVVKPLTSDVSIGAQGVSVDNSDGAYAVGQYVSVWDDNSPTQGGGGTRPAARGGVITQATETFVGFGKASEEAFSVSGNAQIMHTNSGIIINGSNVRISGTGVIDGNFDAHTDVQPLAWNNPAETGGCGIYNEGFDNVQIDGVTVQNWILHGIVYFNCGFGQLTNSKSINIHDKAVLLRAFSDGYLNNVEVNSFDEDGLSLYSSVTRCRINNITAYECARHGVLLNTENTKNNVFNNIHLRDNYSPIAITNAVGNVINNPYIIGDGATSPYAVSVNGGKAIEINDINVDGVSPANVINISGASEDVSVNRGSIRNNSTSVAFAAGGATQKRISFNDIVVDGVNNIFNIASGGSANDVVFRRCHITNYTNIGNVEGRARFVGMKGDFKTGNSSTATIKSGRTFVAINHGLSITPLPQNIIVTPTNAKGVGFWISDILSTSFTINVAEDPGAETATFTWAIVDQDIPVTNEVSYTDNYVSDFSSGVDGFTSTRAVAAGNQDGIGGKDDCLIFYASADNNTHQINKAAVSVGNYNRVSFEVFIPSGQSVVNGVRLLVNGSTVAYDVTGILDEWIRVTTNEFLASSATISFYLRGTSGTSFAGANSPNDDSAFIKNVVVEYRVP